MINRDAILAELHEIESLLEDDRLNDQDRFVEPCRPSKADRPPSGPQWVHEVKHDGFRLMVRRDGARVRCFTRKGHDWADRFPAIVEAARTMKAVSFLIDGEAVICRDDGISDFNALCSLRGDHDVSWLFST